MGIMAKELEMTQMVQMLQAIPKDSPAFNVILVSMMQNSSIHNRDQIVASLTQGNQPNPEAQQMQQQHMQLQMQQAQADIEKTMAMAEEERAKATKWYAEAQELAPDELKYQEKTLKLQEKMMGLEKTKADIHNKNSETARNIPEVEHLKSETVLNLATAREKAHKTVISGMYQ